MKTFYLKPINGRGSFNCKCHVNEYSEKGSVISDLISYETKVASYNHTTNKMQVFGWFSATTSTHINAFLNFYGFKSCSKQDLINYNNNN